MSSGNKVKSVNMKETTNIIDTNLAEDGDKNTTISSWVGFEPIMDRRNPDAKINAEDKKSKSAKGNDIKLPHPEIIPSIPPSSIPDEVVDYSSSDDDDEKKPKKSSSPSSSNNNAHPGAIHVAGTDKNNNNRQQMISRNEYSGNLDEENATALEKIEAPIVAKVVEDDLEDRAIELENEKNELAQELARYNNMPVITGEVAHQDEKNHDDKVQKHLCNRYIIVAFFTLAIGGIIAGTTIPMNDDAESSSSDDPIDRVMPLLSSISDETAINEKDSHRNMAFNWVLDQYNSSSSDAEIIQSYILSLLYFSTEGGRWTNQYDFLTGFDVCGWNNDDNDNSTNGGGVICNPDGVREIYLSTNNLNGTVPSEIGNLRNLKILDFENNDLTGTIPATVGDLRNLKNLTLGYNKLTGTIPPAFGDCEIIYYLHLQHNNLIGTIPSALGNIDILWSLYLHNNDLSGSIPPALGNFEKLMDMYLNDNSLTGTIPSTFDNFARVEIINVTNNDLTGDLYFLCNVEKNTKIYADCSDFDSPPPCDGERNDTTSLFSANCFNVSSPPCSCSSCDCCQSQC